DPRRCTRPPGGRVGHDHTRTASSRCGWRGRTPAALTTRNSATLDRHGPCSSLTSAAKGGLQEGSLPMGKKVCRVRSRARARGLGRGHEPARGRAYELNHRAESILREMAFVYHLTSRVRTAMTRDAE